MDEKSEMLRKIKIPEIWQELLPRPAIAEIINKTPLGEMIYLSAPFGCGKTMAVIAWLKKYNKKAVWLSLDKDDNLPISFWSYLSASFLQCAGQRENAVKILSGNNVSPNPQQLFRQTILQTAGLLEDKILVIDNFKFIQDDNLLCEIKDFIVDMLGNWRIIIIGRGQLAPVFDSFVLKKRLCLITLNELEFSQDEMNAYFSLNKIKVSEDELTELYQDTAGWPAAINAAVTVSGADLVKYNADAKNYVISYFENEIWQQLNEKTKIFLLKTSVLDKLTPAVCRHISDMENAGAILKDLHFNGIFILTLAEKETYYYHRIFRDFLFEKLALSDIDAKTLYVKAGWWLYEKNEHIAAMLSFHKACNISGIDMAFKKISPADIGMEEYLETTLFLRSLDIGVLKDYPETLAKIAFTHFLTGNLCKMQCIYEFLLKNFDPDILSVAQGKYVELFWELQWLRYVNPDENIVFDEKFVQWNNIKNYNTHLLESDYARAAMLNSPSALRSTRDFSNNKEYLEKYHKMSIESETFSINKARMFLLDLAMAEIAYEREEYNRAEEIIREILPEIKKLKLSDLYFSSLNLLAKISRAANNSREVDELASYIKLFIINNGHLFLLPNFHAFELRNRLADGIAGMSEVFKKENEPYKDNACFHMIYRQITFVRALLSEERFSEAKLILGNLELLCRQYKRNLDMIEINILRSIAEYGLGYEKDAGQCLMTAIAEGRKGGFIRIFSDNAVKLWQVLRFIHKSDKDTYVRKIIISCKKTLTRAGVTYYAEKTMRQTLTKKELVILNLLQSGMSYEEIALDNNIKVGTVRAHIHSIYSKLNADNRISAIVLAQKNKLIKDTPPN